MKFVSRAFFAIAVVGAMLAQSAVAQQFSKVPDSEQPATSAPYVPYKEYLQSQQAMQNYNYVRPQAAPAPGEFGEAVFVGEMINAYTSQSNLTNQLGYDWVKDVITTIYRAGPKEDYPNLGVGSLVLNTSEDGGNTWSGNSPIFNLDLLGNIPGSEHAARHPSIYSMNIEGTTSIATIWSNIHATDFSSGVLAEIAYKAGPLGGPYSGGRFNNETILHYFPIRICSDQAGNLFSLFQTINKDNEEFTGEMFVTKSTDNGMSWQVDYSNPAVSEEDLADDYQIYYSSLALDVSPDGTTLYLGFIGIFVTDGSFRFADNRLGYVRSTDGGATWSNPVMYPLYEWDMGETPVNAFDGWMLPSIGLAVDGNNEPHFLMSVYGADTFFPLDSTLVGELTIDPADDDAPPSFYALAINLLPDFRRKVNPRDAETGAQPTFTLWGEHDWSKTPDGKRLIAKWIDADSIFVTTPDTHPQPFIRDSTHDIFICEKDIDKLNNGANGWAIDGATNTHFIQNVTESVGVDEKLTKINPKYNPDRRRVYFLYTIMATGEFVPGQIYPDTDDLGPAELYLIPWELAVSVEHTPEGLPEGFSIEQNFPNPFNPATTIRFSLPTAGMATVRVMNMLGQEVAVAYNGYTEAGSHSFTFDATNLPSGPYVYRLESAGYSVAKMMTLMK